MTRTMKTLIAYLNEALDSGGMTVTALARAAGCSRQHIYSVISGESQPSMQMAEKLAESIGYTIEVKVSRKGSKKQVA